MIPKEDFKMLGQQQENFLNRVTQALTRPVQSRCAELAVLFDRGTMKDLQTIYPLLIDSVFGPHGTICWELRTKTSTANHQDFQALQHFLSPLGPMFKLIYTLLRDPLMKFEFSLTYLPSKIQQSLNGSMMHPFYIDLVNVNPQTGHAVSLMLNPFDYYFFHFAYHLINPFHQRAQVTGPLTWSTVYYVLCCDYVIHFLPTNPSNPVIPVLNFYNGKNPTYMLPSFNKPPKTSRLFRTDVQTPNKMQTLQNHPRNEIWRSETIMTVFIDMWLNNDQVVLGDYYFDRSQVMVRDYKPRFQVNNLLTGEYIRIVRVLVKQLHSFSSSARVDDTHMGELKRIVIPYLQGKMYTFLRHLVHRWPLDGSFRLVLELWLSFLQPWRYPANEYMKMNGMQETNADLEEGMTTQLNTVELDKEYMQFIAENLLAYTVLLQQLIPRFCKIDLSSPKIALILYRLTKVFSQPNLVPYLREIEKCTENFSNSPVHSYMANTSNNLPSLSPTATWSTNSYHSFNSTTDPEKDLWNRQNGLNDSSSSDNSYRQQGGKWESIVKQKILELEGPGFCYKPIFCTTPAPEVFNLMQHIKISELKAQQIVHLRIDEMTQHPKGFFNMLKSIFTTETYNDEFTLEERRKVPNYLQLSLSNLKQMFQMPEDSDIGQIQSVEDVSANSSFQNDISYMLTPQRVRERMKTLEQEGDPDLFPIRSDEVKVLVRLLYQLTLKINEDFGPVIHDLYNKQNFLGSLSRQFISPPMTIFKYDKSFPGRSPRVPQQLPPRIRLRYFASQKFLFYFVIGIILSKLCGYGYLTFICIIFAFWFMYVCLKAACDRRQGSFVTPNEVAMEVDNFSANESL